MSDRPSWATSAFARSMMMREAIASCQIEGAVVTPERAQELIRLATVDLIGHDDEEATDDE